MTLSVDIKKKLLTSILDQGVEGMCVCPAELARQIINIRKLYDYQEDCLKGPDNAESHRVIRDAAEQSHRIMEKALLDVLKLEGWDLESMKMPDSLKKTIQNKIKSKSKKK